MFNKPILTVFAVILGACGGGNVPAGDVDAGSAVDSGSEATDSGPADSGAPDADPAAPNCVITNPTDGSERPFDVQVTLMATASDPQDGTLTGASVVWRSSLQVAPLGSGTTLSTLLPVGTNVITCTATDSDAKTGSSTITVIARSPVAKINHPGDGETRPASAAVPFVGVARDKEDGTLSGASLVWTSSLDGQIGTGQTFSKQLSAGVHTITLTATDSNANTATDSIALTITP